MADVLVVDDFDGFTAVQRVLQPEGFILCRAQGFAYASTLCRQTRFDLALIDLRLGTRDTPGSGLDLIRQVSPKLVAITLSDSADQDHLVQSVALGAHNYLCKPVTRDNLLPLVRAALGPLAQPSPLQRLVGTSRAIADLRARVSSVAAHDVRVLIIGPSGSGKELVARAIHDLSRRRSAPFLAVNCAALPRELVESELFGYERGAFTGATNRRRGVFELAHQGTLLLDEIEELAPEAQAKLLRVLEELRFRRVGGEEEISVDVRVLAASNTDLRALVSAGRFRQDLYYRLNVVTLKVPPLDERLSDIPELIAHFLRELGGHAIQLTPEAKSQLRSSRWVGNVRELRNLVERSLVFSSGSQIDPLDLIADPADHVGAFADHSIATAINHLNTAFASAIRTGERPKRLLATIERSLAHTALTLAAGNKTAAARWLELDRKTLERRLSRGEPLEAA